MKSQLRSNYIVLGLTMALSAGCGGGGGGGATSTATPGAVRFSIAWPTANESPTLKRLIPFNSVRVRISVTDPITSADLAVAVTVDRNADAVQHVVINNLRSGTARVGAQALDANNVQLAAGTVDTTITAGITNDVNLTLFPGAPTPPGL